MNPELTPHLETVTSRRVVLDGDTLGSTWGRLYKTLAKTKNFSYFPIETDQQLRIQLELAKQHLTQLVIILSGQQLYDSQQNQWLQLITEAGFRENVVVITGHVPDSPEWKYVADKYQLKLMYKDPAEFGRSFQNLLEDVAVTKPTE